MGCVLAVLVLGGGVVACSGEKGEPEAGRGATSLVEVEPGAQAEPETEPRVLRFDRGLMPEALTFSPIEAATTLGVVVSGFANNTDAEEVQLEIEPVGALTFLIVGHTTEETRRFEVSVAYDSGAAIPEGLALRLSLRNIPQGYKADEAHTIPLVFWDGLTRARAIPLTQGNIQAFNHYAGTVGLDRHYQLREDIRLFVPQAHQSNWTPIGTPGAPFAGSFDGQGFRLSGLTLNAPDRNEQGLFGVIGEGAMIENLGLEGVLIEGNERIGGVAGWNRGEIVGCYIGGSVIGAYAGGVAGRNDGVLRGCYTAGAVVGHMEGGGIVGRNEGRVEDCYATGEARGAAAGGIAGYNFNSIQNCYATGEVEATVYAGGVVGAGNGVLQNCVALNPSVTVVASGGGVSVGRVLGHLPGDSHLSNNHARGNMRIGFGATPEQAIDDVFGIDGGSVEGGEGLFGMAFWTQNMGWDLTSVWQERAGGLPILRNVGGTQPPMAP